MSTPTVLTMVIAVATTSTYLYARYGVQTTAAEPTAIPRVRAHRNIDGGGGRDLAVTESPADVVVVSARAVHRVASAVGREEDVVRDFTLPDGTAVSAAAGRGLLRTSRDRTADGNAPRANVVVGRSLDAVFYRGGDDDDDGPQTPEITAAVQSPLPPFGLQSGSARLGPRPVYLRTDGVGGTVDDHGRGNNDVPSYGAVIDGAEVYLADKRPKNQKRINYNGYSNTMNGKLMVQDYGSNNFQNPYWITNSMGNSNHKKNENPTYGTRWTTLGHQDPMPYWPGTEGEIWETPHESGYPYPNNHEYGNVLPPNSLTPHDHYPVYYHKHVANGWKQIGTFVILKLGFLKILLTLIYKIVIFTRLMSFKFQVIQKVTDLFNALPEFILKLFTTIMNISMTVLMLINSLMRPVNQGEPQDIPGSLPNRISDVIPNMWSNLVKRITPQNPSNGPIQTGISGRTIDSRLQSESLKYYTPGLKTKRSFNLDSLNLTNKHSYESFRLFEPTFDTIKNVLDSERYVKRIVCLIAAEEKSGTSPFWIHWVLNGISNIISDYLLKSYFKTHKVISKELHTKLPAPDDWITWFLDRFNYNNTYTTKVTDTKQ